MNLLGEAPATVYRELIALLADGVIGRVSHGAAQLPSSQRYYLTANGIGEAAGCPRICDSLGLRARLSCVARVASVADPTDGRGRLHPSSRRLVRGGVP